MSAYILGITKRVIRGLQIGAGFRDCKFGQIGAASWISNRGKKITNLGRDYKSGQNREVITNRCRTPLKII